jgi:hypothetical protein
VARERLATHERHDALQISDRVRQVGGVTPTRTQAVDAIAYGLHCTPASGTYLITWTETVGPFGLRGIAKLAADCTRF